MQARCVVGTLLCLVAGFPSPASAEEQAIAIRAGRLVDTVAGRMAGAQVILVRGGVIEDVGPDVQVPAGARVIDLGAYTVLPGLIDAHTHLTIDQGNQDPLAELEHSAAERAFGSIPNARAVLLAGFTTVRDLGSYRALVDVALRDAINRGDVIGPRMYVAGAYVTIAGGAGAVTGFAPDVTLPWDLRYGAANSPSEVRERVRLLAGQRVDVIKMFATGAVLTHNSNPAAREATPEELAAGADEAHNFGLKLAVHAHGAAGIKAAIRAGAASIEHGTLMDEEGRALMKQHGTYLVPTLEVRECVGKNYPPEFVSKAQQIMTAQLANFRKAVNAGVKIGFGTDIGVCRFGSNAREFTLMVENGMTAMQAIQAATTADAELLGVSQKLGSITRGKLADVIAVRGDPLQNVRLLEDVRFVMKEGRIYKAD
ncbi:MAG TPA: amidohydrolase family protein [Steroidobacteraceae bacterium]|jgi:imidazolonepropionase-like amidohydrolase|nr:amidohydrolase family protein [Steroidobacteraceae bacterium]